MFHHVCEVEQHLIGDTRVAYFPFWGSRVSRREGAGNSKRPSGVSSLSLLCLYPLISRFFPPAISIFISFFFPIEGRRIVGFIERKRKKKLIKELPIFSLDVATKIRKQEEEEEEKKLINFGKIPKAPEKEN